ncbi:MAG: hypothetical protein KHZ72_09990 [Lachnospiraceae bacterium]|nr:hypothetical protein [Lachnospiraceae bacterium]
MKGKIGKGFLCLGMMGLVLSGCQPAGQENQTTGEKEQTVEYRVENDAQKKNKEVWVENPLSEEERSRIEGKEQMSNGEREMYINAIVPCEPLNLTREQKLEDFDFFWNTIREKLYCLDDIFSEAGVKYEEYIAEFRSQIAESKSDYEFWEIFDKSVGICRGHWHADLLAPYATLVDGITLAGQIDIIRETTEGEQNQKLKYWDVLVSQENYQYKSNRQGKVMSEAMPELKIIDEDTAVITVPTFGYNAQREKAGDLFIEYMKQVSDYKNVIFDLKGNRGGVSSFVYHNLITPNIEQPLKMKQVKFFKMKEDIAAADRIPDLEGGPWNYRVGYQEQTIYASTPLSQLPEKMRIKNGDYGNADYFSRSDITVFPRFDHKILKGKIWVLTYPENYSSAELFTILCKNTGFATLVGKQTKGDGGGGMPFRFILPNSGLVGSVQCAWTLNEDGTNNANEGTSPDIESPEGETPLETCLRVIEEAEENE